MYLHGKAFNVDLQAGVPACHFWVFSYIFLLGHNCIIVVSFWVKAHEWDNEMSA